MANPGSPVAAAVLIGLLVLVGGPAGTDAARKKAKKSRHSEGEDAKSSAHDVADSVCDGGEGADGQSCRHPFGEQMWARTQFPEALPESVTPLAPQLPRVSVKDLKKPENRHFRMRTRPFILTGAMDDWPGMRVWPISKDDLENSVLGRLFPRAVCDFYPYNMLEQGTHPFLIRFAAGLKEAIFPPGRFTDPVSKHPHACEEGCRYLHLQLTPSMWRKLEERKELPVNRHPHTSGDHWWMRRCLTDPDVQDEYHLKTHWKIILIGTRGSGMFNHTDSLRTSSWHGHVQGRKWWYLCGKNDGFGPREGETDCFESVLHPGEILYYGPGWWHNTRNLDSPSMTITGTVIHKYNFEYVADKLHSECSQSALSFDFSGKLCDALDECYRVWHRVLRGKEASESRWPPWRQVASATEIREKDARLPTQNNYDGRNFISE